MWGAGLRVRRGARSLGPGLPGGGEVRSQGELAGAGARQLCCFSGRDVTQGCPGVRLEAMGLFTESD